MTKFIYWAPRVLSIIFILFIAMFSLDIFGNGYGFWETAIGLFMHNIPTLILAIILWIAWKREIVGAVAFIGAGLAYISMVTIGGVINNGLPWYLAISWSLTIAGPAFLAGILFWVGWRRKKKLAQA